MSARFNGMARELEVGWNLEDILPKVLPAGANAGRLTEEGAHLLDCSGRLEAGIPF